MEKYDNFMSQLDENDLEMMAGEQEPFNEENMKNIKRKFKEKSKMIKIKNKNTFKKIALGLTSAAAVFAAMVNMDVTFAANMLDVPVLGQLVDIVRMDKISMYDRYREINIEIPAVEGLADKKAQDQINDLLQERGMAVYDKVMENAEALKLESEKSGFVTSIPENASQSYEIVRKDEKMLVFKVVTTQIKASGYQRMDSYNIDVENSKLLKLEDLFKRGYDYEKAINGEISRMMNEAIEKEEAGYFPEEFEGVDSQTNFYISVENKLVIVFDEYEIAAGYMGMPEFTIGTEIFGNNLSKNGYIK